MPTATVEKKKSATKQSVSKIKVANTEVILGTVYEIVGKKDYNALEGLQKHNSTKWLIPGIKEHRGIVYDEILQRWDTGFEEDSYTNNRIPRDEKEVLVDLYVNYIQKPYERWSRKDTDATNDDFWADYTVELYTGKTFDTTSPKDLFDLFHALKQGKICEVNEKDAVLQKANYCVKNREETTSLKEQKLLDKAEAFSTLSILLDAHDPEKDDTLYTILEWMNINSIRGAEKDAIKKTVLRLFDNEKTGTESIDRFLEAYRMSKSDVQKEEMELFSILTKLQIKRKLEYKRKEYWLDEFKLGSSLKIIAKTAFKNPEMKQHIIDAYEEIA